MLITDFKNKMTAVYLLMVLFLPVFHTGESVVLLFSTCLAFAYIISTGRVVYSVVPIFFFIALQLLLIVSMWNDASNGLSYISDIPSVLRPISMLVIYMGFFIHILKSRSLVFFEEFVFLSAIALLFFLIAGMNVSFVKLQAILYYGESRLGNGAFLSVFATTYFAVYFYYILYAYSLSRISVIGLSVKWVCVLLLSLIYIFLSQGKSGYIAVIFTPFVILFVRHKWRVRFIITFIAIVLICVCVSYLESLSKYMLDSKFYSLRQAGQYMKYGTQFDAAGIRLEQIASSFQGSLSNYMMGIGLGRGVYLESYIATFLYRYGIVGLVLYSSFFMLCAYYAWDCYAKEEKRSVKVVYLFVLIWFVNLPVLMLSSPMFEMGKNAIFSMLVLAVLFGQKSLLKNESRLFVMHY